MSALLARAHLLVDRGGQACLGTAAAEHEGWPYTSLVLYAVHAGHPVLLLSRLAEHTKNLATEPRCSLLVSEAGPDDPLALGRVTLLCRAEPLPEPGEARQAFLARHPTAATYVDFADFGFVRLRIEQARIIEGFGRMTWLHADGWAQGH